MLIFQNGIAEQIYTHAKNEYPKECCGIILGRRLGKQRIADRIIQALNITNENNAAAHFQIDSLEVVRAETQAENDGLEIIGFYHSHPDCETVASNEDVLHMIEGYSYPIISVKKGICVGINSFEKLMQRGTKANQEEILIKEK